MWHELEDGTNSDGLRDGSLAGGLHSLMGNRVGTQLIFSICLSFPCVIPNWEGGKMRSPD